MAYEVIYKKRFLNKVAKLTAYIESEWGSTVAESFAKNLGDKILQLKKHPFIGSLQGRDTVRSIIVGNHNRLYYQIDKQKIIIINLFDMRTDPEKNPYKK